MYGDELVWAVLLCGIGLTIVVVLNAYIGLGANRWPNTRGKVVVSEIQMIKDPLNRNQELFSPVVVYEYAIGGRIYRSKRLGNFLFFNGKEMFAQSITAKFGSNSDVKVYYNRLFPSTSVLIPGVQQLGLHLLLLTLGIVTSVGAGFAIFGR